MPVYRQQTVTLKFSADCGIDRAQGTNFKLEVGPSAFALHADPPTAAHPNWVAVGVAYLAALLVALAILALAYSAWTPPQRPGTEKDLQMPLPGLSDSWKFADSWSANATVVTALFAGVFGVQGAAEALLGKSAAKEVLAVAVVAAAISLGLTGLSPMILQSLRTRTGEVPEVRVNDVVVSPKVDAAWYVTPRGLLAASLFTLVGTAGQLGAILWAVKETDFGQDWVVWLLLILGAVGLAWYAWQTTSQSLDAGAKTPTAADMAKEAQGKVEEAQLQQREVDNLRATASPPDAIAAEERKAADLNSQAVSAVASLRSVLEVTQAAGRPSPIP